jgi:hypothetical protein
MTMLTIQPSTGRLVYLKVVHYPCKLCQNVRLYFSLYNGSSNFCRSEKTFKMWFISDFSGKETLFEFNILLLTLSFFMLKIWPSSIKFFFFFFICIVLFCFCFCFCFCLFCFVLFIYYFFAFCFIFFFFAFCLLSWFIVEF